MLEFADVCCQRDKGKQLLSEVFFWGKPAPDPQRKQSLSQAVDVKRNSPTWSFLLGGHMQKMMSLKTSFQQGALEGDPWLFMLFNEKSVINAKI